MERGVISPSTASPCTSSASSSKCTFNLPHPHRPIRASETRATASSSIERLRRARRRPRPRRSPAAGWWSCPSPTPPRRACGRSRSRTIPATRAMASADSTEVPPNFITIIFLESQFIRVHSRPDILRHHQFRVQHRRARRAAHRVVAQRDEFVIEHRALAQAARRTRPCRSRARRRAAAAAGPAHPYKSPDTAARSAGLSAAEFRATRAKLQ